ncbi:hypothetical protein D3C75_1142470 [compost metagenome]
MERIHQRAHQTEHRAFIQRQRVLHRHQPDARKGQEHPCGYLGLGLFPGKDHLQDRDKYHRGAGQESGG